METKLDYLNRIFNEARMRGMCKNQNEFADLVGMNPSTISNAMKGKDRYLTDSFIKRIKAWEVVNLEPVREPEKDARPDIRIPAATVDLYTSMAKSIDRLTALVERMQPGASAFAGAAVTAPKNYRVED